MPHSSLAIANEFIRRSLEPGARPITQMQVQKLVYLAHGWNLGARDEPLIEDPVEAWKFGPVIRKLYSALSRYGSGPITRRIRWGDDTPLYGGDDGGVAHEELGRREREVVEMIWDTYGEYPAFQLSALTHQPNTPWSQYYSDGSNRVIPNRVIQRHFKALIGS